MEKVIGPFRQCCDLKGKFARPQMSKGREMGWALESDKSEFSV